MTTPDYPIVRVTARQLQDMFNEGNYWERAKNGEFRITINRNTHPTITAANEPHCTWTQEVSYRDPNSDEEIVRVHQYERPDKTIGASGRPDPKRMLVDGVLYRLQKKPKLG